jgi:hypothetical protein
MEMELEQIIQQLTPYMGAPTAVVAAPPAAAARTNTVGVTGGGALFQPSQQDTLVWCCYVILYGIKEYHCQAADRKMELDFKIKLSGEITKNPAQFKMSNHKITKQTIEETKSNLLTGNKMQTPELIAFCAYHQKNVCVLYDNKVMMRITAAGADIEEMTAAGTATLHYNSKTKKYSLDLTENTNTVTDVTKYIQVEQYNKLLRGFSVYKQNELHTMADKLGIGAGMGDTKKELYEIIRHEIQLLFSA